MPHIAVVSILQQVMEYLFCILSRYKERVVIEPHPESKKFENFELSGKILCTVCRWNWGVIGVYKKVPFPIININNFVVVKPNNMREKYKRWKEVPFSVKPISADDLGKMRPADDNDVSDNHHDGSDDDDESILWQHNA